MLSSRCSKAAKCFAENALEFIIYHWFCQQAALVPKCSVFTVTTTQHEHWNEEAFRRCNFIIIKILIMGIQLENGPQRGP